MEIPTICGNVDSSGTVHSFSVSLHTHSPELIGNELAPVGLIYFLGISGTTAASGSISLVHCGGNRKITYHSQCNLGNVSLILILHVV